MAGSVKTRLIRIGNSQGIRIPQPLIKQAGLDSEVEIEAQSGQLVIRPARSPREGWAAAFEAMAEAGDDRLLDAEPLTLTQWEANEWEW